MMRSYINMCVCVTYLCTIKSLILRMAVPSGHVVLMNCHANQTVISVLVQIAFKVGRTDRERGEDSFSKKIDARF